MEKDFIILSSKEEKQLSTEELKEYYKELRKYLLSRKLTNTTPGATTIAPKLKGITNKICVVVTRALTHKNVEIVCDGVENIPEGPIILAQTHQGILDNFVWIPQIRKHCIVLHHKKVKKLLIACQLNTGLILIDKDDKDNSANAKLDIIELLLKGHSVHWSPEGTYCLSPNKLHLPLKYGIIDAAKKAGVPIVPVAHEYTYETVDNKMIITKIQSKYGKPIYVNEEDDLEVKLRLLEESFSTLKYELIEAKGLFSRNEITNYDYIDYLKQIYKDIETGSVDKDEERERIFTSANGFYEFYHINDVPFTEKGEFLDTEEVRKIKAIDQEQEIKRIENLIQNMHQEDEFKRKKLLQSYSQKNFK